MLGAGQIRELERLISERMSGTGVSLEVNASQGMGGTAFRGRTSDGRVIFVKLGPPSEVERSLRAHRACVGLPFVPKLIVDGVIPFGDRAAICTDFISGRIIRNFEDMSPAQLASLVVSYLEFSNRIQSLSESDLYDNIGGSVEADMDELRRYAGETRIGRFVMRDLLSIDLKRLRAECGERRVIHNDLNVSNYVFRDEKVSVIYDYDILALGMPCEDLVMVPAIRSREAGLSPSRRRRMKERFHQMVLATPWTVSEWRAALNAQRIRWARFLLSRKRGARMLPLKIMRRDRRMRILFSVLDELERRERVH